MEVLPKPIAHMIHRIVFDHSYKALIQEYRDTWCNQHQNIDGKIYWHDECSGFGRIYKSLEFGVANYRGMRQAMPKTYDISIWKFVTGSAEGGSVVSVLPPRHTMYNCPSPPAHIGHAIF
jgi:hypothetical protein